MLMTHDLFNKNLAPSTVSTVEEVTLPETATTISVTTTTAKKFRIFGSVRDDLKRYVILRVKRGVYKDTGMDFHCCEDTDDFKYTFDHVSGQNRQFSHYYSIFASKFSQENISLNARKFTTYRI